MYNITYADIKSQDILNNIRTYSQNWNHPVPSESYHHIIRNDVLYIMSHKNVDYHYLYYLFQTYPHVHYILWSNENYENDDAIIENSRDTFITLLYNTKLGEFSNNFIIVQRCRFSLDCLAYFGNYYNHLNSILMKLGLSNHVNHFTSGQPYFTYFFTVYCNYIDYTPNYKYVLPSYNINFIKNKPIIFQTWITHGSNSHYIWDCYQHTSTIYKNYTYLLFSDFEMKHFVKKHYDQTVLEQYDNIIPSAFKSDFFRYLFLYKFGGLYMDISLKPHTDIFSYIEDIYSLSNISFFSPIDNGYTDRLWNGLMYAKPNHPFMKYCIDKIMNLKKSNVRNCLFYTGPGLLGEAVSKLGQIYDDYLLLSFTPTLPIIDPKNPHIPLISPKGADGWVQYHAITNNMYAESNKSHYSNHCLYNEILLY